MKAKETIDVVITATLRPELLYQTLKSFTDKLLPALKCRAIINVDPVGIKGVTQKEVVDVCREFFSNTLSNTPKRASFPHAFKWAWSQARAPWVFHLEDDWELVRLIDLDAMINLFNKYENLVVLRLPYKVAGTSDMKNWNLFFPWNGEFFECPKDQILRAGMCGHPSLIRGSFVRKAAVRVAQDKNPEKQFHHRNSELKRLQEGCRFGVFAQPGDPIAIVDIGRGWLEANGLGKKGTKAFFTEWEEVNP